MPTTAFHGPVVGFCILFYLVHVAVLVIDDQCLGIFLLLVSASPCSCHRTPIPSAVIPTSSLETSASFSTSTSSILQSLLIAVTRIKDVVVTLSPHPRHVLVVEVVRKVTDVHSIRGDIPSPTAKTVPPSLASSTTPVAPSPSTSAATATSAS